MRLVTDVTCRRRRRDLILRWWVPNVSVLLWMQGRPGANMATNHQRLMEQSVLRLQELVKARRELDAAILKVQRCVRWAAIETARENGRFISLSLTSTDTGHLGVTEAVRKVLNAYPIWLSPVAIRDLLPTIGFDFTRYKHPLTSIHSILRRLVAVGEVVRADHSQAGSVYAWAAYLKGTSILPADVDSKLVNEISDAGHRLETSTASPPSDQLIIRCAHGDLR